MYDVTSNETWERVDAWCQELDEDAVILIAGNKLDLVQSNKKQREILFNEVEKYARKKNALAIEGSAIENLNVNKMFQSVVEEYFVRFGVPEKRDVMGLNNNQNKSNSNNDKNKNKNKNSGCC